MEKNMREIKFRGKSVHTGIWHYGDLLQLPNNVCLIQEIGTAGILTDPDTVGQFTGLHDKNGKEIYEGDILKVDFLNYTTEVYYNKDAFMTKTTGTISHYISEVCNDCKVIGNIHSNPELINK